MILIFHGYMAAVAATVIGDLYLWFPEDESQLSCSAVSSSKSSLILKYQLLHDALPQYLLETPVCILLH